MSVSEAAVFAAEFAEAVGDKRCNGHRKFYNDPFVGVRFSLSLYTDKQEFKIDGTGHIVLRPALPVLFQDFPRENHGFGSSYRY